MSESILNKLFTNLSLLFDDRDVDLQHLNIPFVNSKFGILDLKAVNSSLSQEEHEFIFKVDCSGSMSDKCADGRSKMQHIIHTLKNMILYFKENPSIKHHITIDAFDDKIHRIIERSIITDESYSLIIEKINGIEPRGNTNIELAVRDSKNIIDNIQSNYPTHNISHIFMTDGQATDGNINHDFLSKLVDRSVANLFIGFGIDHDSSLLNDIADGDNSSYYFIDKLENAGLVYGEILHSILYKHLCNVEISLENGLIYDFKTNNWVKTLQIGEIVSEANKIYHIASDKPEECVISLRAITLDYQDINLTIKSNYYDVHLRKYIYRQRTLQYLFKVKDFLKRKYEHTTKDGLGSSLFRRNQFDLPDDSKFISEENGLKKELENFMYEIKNYMIVSNITEDKFMKNLCDDIYICYRTIGTKFGHMFAAARQTSQGTQRCYTVSQTPDMLDDVQNTTLRVTRPPRLTRQTNQILTDFSVFTNSPDDNELAHEVSDFFDTPYLTPSATRLMREISGNCGVVSEESM
jgi:hypothetical protein